jgi:glucan phosphoethanolaminetransferase (alkaline phosphatase superfamily)
VMVVMVGESARWASFQVNCYERPTTPNLAAMPDLLNFKDVAAPGPCTMLSVPSILSAADASQVKEASSHPSVIQVFRKAGFWTAWFSTQKKHGSMATICSQFADDADEALFLNGRLDFVGTEAKLDGQLITEVDRVLAAGHDRVLIVLHAIGNHSPYHLRHPREFAKWPVDEAQCTRFGVRVSEQESMNLINSYDNTVLYTDWVLGQIVERLKRLPTASAMYFISDHGENLNHPVASPFFHGQWTRDVMHIPMFVWLSPSYRAAMPDKVAQLTLRQASPFSGDATFHTLLDMAGLDCNRLERSKSLASPAWTPSRRLMIGWEGNIGDYDTDLIDGTTAQQDR